MCEFHDSSGNGFGDIWWTDNPIYFSSIDGNIRLGTLSQSLPKQLYWIFSQRGATFHTPTMSYSGHSIGVLSFVTQLRCVDKKTYLITYLFSTS